MKPRVLVLSSVLVIALVGLYFTSSRDQQSNPPMANINSAGDPAKEMRLERLTKLGTADNNADPVTTDKSQNTDESHSDENCLDTVKDFKAGDIKVISMKFRSGNYFAYPQIAVPSTPQERKFNLYVQKLLRINPKNDEVCAEKVDPDCESNQNEADEETDFSLQYATPEFVSIGIGWLTQGSTGASFYYPASLNYDLEAGRPVKKLTDLFESKSKNLEVISGYVDSELRKCGYDDKQIGLCFWADIKPKLASYSEWELTRNGVMITVPWLRPGDFLFVVVPYSHLKGMLRQDIAWFRRLQLK